MAKALEWIVLFGTLAAAVAGALARGEPERVEKILPDELKTTLEAKRAHLEASTRFAPQADRDEGV
jgi:hypothetical protein